MKTLIARTLCGMTSILWLEHNLRLADNEALRAACKGGAVIPLYILDDETPAEWKMGSASRAWLHHSLLSLDAALKANGSQLILRRGKAEEVLRALADETGAIEIHAQKEYAPWAHARSERIREMLPDVALIEHPGQLLFEPERIRTGAGKTFHVYTPFSRACFDAAKDIEEPLPKPQGIPAPHSFPSSETLSEWQLIPTKPKWDVGFWDLWEPGEVGAHKRLAHFLDTRVHEYKTGRDVPSLGATSRLSPHLHCGEVSVRTVWKEGEARARSAGAHEGGTTFLKEILWREFSYHLLNEHPDMPRVPLQKQFTKFTWAHDPKNLRAWQKGMTGYPIVDAGMRELWATGYMHNRVRMITASFLIKDLLINWTEGEKWFWDALVDADIGNNSASWQWVAGCGADAAPYFRIFNPTLQGKKFDSDGAYVKKWIPELHSVPTKYIHEPWESPEGLPAGYPERIVIHAEARDRALRAYGLTK